MSFFIPGKLYEFKGFGHDNADSLWVNAGPPGTPGFDVPPRELFVVLEWLEADHACRFRILASNGCVGWVYGFKTHELSKYFKKVGR